MRKILTDVAVAVPRFALRAAVPESATGHVSRVTPRHTELPVPDEKQQQQWRQAAERLGYEAGYEAGMLEAGKRADQEFARLAGLCESLRLAQTEQRQQWQDFAVEFSFAVATRVLASAAPGRAGVQGVVEAALSQLDNAAAMCIRVHPNDVAWVRELVAGPAESTDGDAIKVLADTQVKQGGCLLDTTQGTLDARLEAQCLALKEALLAAYRAVPPETAG